MYVLGTLLQITRLNPYLIMKVAENAGPSKILNNFAKETS